MGRRRWWTAHTHTRRLHRHDTPHWQLLRERARWLAVGRQHLLPATTSAAASAPASPAAASSASSVSAVFTPIVVREFGR